MADELDMDALALIGARALAHSHGLDYDEVCGIDANPDNGECDSGTCISAHYEDHDAEYARSMYRADARAILTAIDLPAIIRKAKAEAYEDAAKVARIVCRDEAREYRNEEYGLGILWVATPISAAIRQRAKEEV